MPKSLQRQRLRDLIHRTSKDYRQRCEIWNDNDPLLLAVAHDYERQGLQNWDNVRIKKLARSLGITVWGLCAQAGCFEVTYDPLYGLKRLVLDKKFIKQCWDKNSWPVYFTINFDRMERYVKARDNPENPPPLLGAADAIGAKILAVTV